MTMSGQNALWTENECSEIMVDKVILDVLLMRKFLNKGLWILCHSLYFVCVQ